MTATTGEKKITLFILTVAAIIYVINAITFDGSFGGGDGIRHYLVARYSWQHPEQLLYHWGKPFFTLISSPFAQFGLYGIKIFNSLLGISTAYIAFLIAVKLNLKHAWLVTVMVLFNPLFIQTVNSGLTEPMFAFLIMLCAWMFMNEKFLEATLLVSFLPFVRSEGNLILPLFACILFIRKKFLIIPLLAFGTVAYSIIGYFYYHDLFWIQTQNPYKGHNYDIYGKGPLTHYVLAYDEILGLPQTILYCIGLLVIIILAWKQLPKLNKLFSEKNLIYDELFLIHAAFIVYFVAHSIFWWKGLFGSLGLTRSLAGVVPFAAFTCYRAMLPIIKVIKTKPFLTELVAMMVTAIIGFYAFQRKYFPLQLEPEESVIKSVCEWYKTQEFNPPKIYYLFPWLAHGLNIDAFDPVKTGELWGLYPAIKEWGLDAAVPIGTLVFWDSHFGANEAYIPLDSLLKNPNFRLVKSFKPLQPLKTLGGYDFTVNVFERIKFTDRKLLDKTYFDLETDEGIENYGTVTDTLSYSGNKSCVLDTNTEFGVMYARHTDDMPQLANSTTIEANAFCYTENQVLQALMVFAIEDSVGTNLHWESKALLFDTNAWQEVKTSFTIDKKYAEANYLLKIYVWNKGKERFLLDDLKIIYK